jgi:hypothetical protein
MPSRGRGVPGGKRRTQRWEGSRPRDPLFPKLRAFPDQRREYTLGFDNAFPAREDARPPGDGPATPVLYINAHQRQPFRLAIQRAAPR